MARGLAMVVDNLFTIVQAANFEHIASLVSLS